ncbi:hypothetical protein [Paracoccus sp. pheM1]|uniref:hypothetical protein n=1 Tax=Paracoccus sp. pheM1 TaxID=2831675 RepID=UPI001BDB8FDA|nr:hypothetical protein [Paracoccus sp. pheM1]MBT0780556.1 hypothetical protein [Paracoccus sp. pheM1]
MTAQLPVTAAKLPPTTPCNVASMQPRELTEHRLAIGQAVEVILHGYWQPSESETLRAAVLRDWCDTLEGWKPDSVLAALRKWRNENPSKRPNPGHIVQMLKEAWGKKHVEQVRAALAGPVEPPKERISEDRRRAILAEVGLRDPLQPKTTNDNAPTE